MSSTLRILRYVALAEATSFLALLVATYMRYNDQGAMGVHVLGPIHGLLFIAFVVLALIARGEERWPAGTTLLVLLGAVVPFGGYAVDRWLVRSSRRAAAA